MNHNQRKELEKYPKFREAYMRAFERMIAARKENGLNGHEMMDDFWEKPEDVMKWWLGD